MNIVTTLNGEGIARKAMQTPAQQTVSGMKERMLLLPQVPCPLDHEFTGHFYIRTIHVPAGTLVISKIFMADFPFFISKGRVSVWVEGLGVKRFEAPHWGFTKAGTRRIIMHHTDVDWTTFHPVGELRDVDEIEEQIIYDPAKDVSLDIPTEIVRELEEPV